MTRQSYFRVMASTLLVGSVVYSASASASHKSWIMQHSGGQCVFDSPNGNSNFEIHDYATYNGGSFNRSVSCPVALASRWGSTSNPVVGRALWAGAYSAIVYGTNNLPGTSFSCFASGRLGNDSGTTFFSRTVASTSGGDQKLIVASGGDWGLGLETNEASTVRGLGFHCSLPGNHSRIEGYKVRICQLNTDCSVFTDLTGEGVVASTGGKAEWNQTSGIECFPVSGPPSDLVIERGLFGIKNTSNSEFAGLHCPIVPSAEDTNENDRIVWDARVYYTGGTQRPSCQMRWRNRQNGQTGVTEGFKVVQFESGVVKLVTPTPIGASIYQAIVCDIAPGTTIKGVTVQQSVTDVINAG